MSELIELTDEEIDQVAGGFAISFGPSPVSFVVGPLSFPAASPSTASLTIGQITITPS